MRLDIITIFPEYLDPLRHALLGKAIEQGILSVGVHNLRDWATGNHKAVDDSPFGGGPGMVMLPEVWGQALDHVAQLPLSDGSAPQLHSATPHRNDKARHDDVAAVAPRPYQEERDYRDGEDPDAPLLLVPTPAGAPFTQADARAWSREEHIAIACGRYEGIDQRVFVDAAQRYRVREVSIGDYVLIGGEVAALVIAEAVTRLIPGVLGNTESHEEDSFSDGLLEGPSYTKPRQWRGLSAPEVLVSGDHGKIARWRRDEALRRTQQVRPELVDKLRAEGGLDGDDLFTLDARDVSTDIAVIMNAVAWEKSQGKVAKKLRRAGFMDAAVTVELQDQMCVVDNAVVTQYLQAEDGPLLDPVYRVVVEGRTALPLKDATQAVVNALPGVQYWYGTTTEKTARRFG
ncbi:tRNA (guanosine(37)-N1)-methyltransferase TrmD [Corynebacterium genitalium ATCC 33030]|uniref:tRNA (guanine-N(1)-)-methyltransferase n=1 Tax=Corynebacterium genitalium ATCC 33030 TaxID=585529 RepID=D7WF07_9CORY|nr:tRNA (guanosine(37)-N1)-methyltransferase TrmD [Corynebacterium genitalium]EFK53688.1 tRNA (guanine-N(1)-)-methyltransferase [Corynebacterium genitalium ATCC 33030]UUA88737.1 tRNA (guanosine(37)-N1)-methyltransferase TrmD [Corynebacterium genitalium ATCC 33030]